MHGAFQQNNYQVIPPLFFIIGALLVMALGVVSQQNDNERIALETTVTAEQVRLRLESCINSRFNVVFSVASFPWQSQQQVMESWTERISILLPLFSGVQAINYVDPDWTIRVVYPLESNQKALNVNLRENSNPSVAEAVSKAEGSSQITRTNIVELLQSGKGFALYQQIQSADGQALGFVNGVFRVADLMQSCLSEERLRDRFVYRFFDGETLFYQQPSSLAGLDSPYLVKAQIDVAGRPWLLEFAPSEKYLAATDNMLDEMWIALGLLLMLLLAIVVRILLIKQRTLKENEDNYRLLVENQTDMVVKVNPQGEFLYVSPSYCNTFGKSETDLLGKQFLPLVHEEDRELTNRSLARLKRAPHSSYHEQRAMTKEGWRWLAWSNAAVLDENGAIEAITAVGRDVTDVKHLEQRIAHSQKMKAMGEMAGGITHDFNNLLQVILGNIEFLIFKIEDDNDMKAQLLQLCNVVERAMKLTEKLSTLSRQEMTRQEVIDLNEFSTELLSLLKHTLPASIHLSLKQSEELLYVRADKALLEQVILNICFNAKDAIAANGDIAIAINKVELDDSFLGQMPDIEPGDYSCISVTDNGCGIDPGIVKRIFDPFFTTKEAGTGTGLGLANSYSIIKQHKGMILVDSTPGEGSCFSIYLPLSERSAQPARKEQLFDERQPTPKRELILVADDNADILHLTSLTLKSAGYETLACADGQQALDLFQKRESEIGMVLLDLVMPGLSGQEVAERIRQFNTDVKILFVSGFIPDNETEDLKERIVRKPYKRQELLRAVTELLET